MIEAGKKRVLVEALDDRASRALARLAKPDPLESSNVIASFAPAFGRPAWMKRAGCGAPNEGDHKGRPYKYRYA
jgi:hypothetical protein